MGMKKVIYMGMLAAMGVISSVAPLSAQAIISETTVLPIWYGGGGPTGYPTGWSNPEYFVSYSIQGGSSGSYITINTYFTYNNTKYTESRNINIDGTKWVEYLMARLLYAQNNNTAGNPVTADQLMFYQVGSLSQPVTGVKFINSSPKASNLQGIGFFTNGTNSFVEISTLESGATYTFDFNADVNGVPFAYIVGQLVQVPMEQSSENGGPLYQISSIRSSSSCTGYLFTNLGLGYPPSRFWY